jgi:hypothetical protein
MNALEYARGHGEIPRKARDDAPSLPPPCSAQGGSVYHNVFYGKAATIFGWFDLQMERWFASLNMTWSIWKWDTLLLAGLISWG